LATLPDGAGAPDDDDGASPYRGLLAFDQRHRGLFFGREAETAAVLGELRAHPLVLVVGGSGAGKSSLVRAGVAPRAEAEGRRALVMVPGARPLDAMARAVACACGSGPSEVAAEIGASPGWLARELSARNERVLLV